MSRIPLLPADIAEPRELVEAAKARRGGELARIDRLLLYSPALARGWTTHCGGMRTDTKVPGRLRELVIIAVSVLTKHQYEVQTHKPYFIAEGGSQAQFDSVQDVDKASSDAVLFDETERAALSLAIEMCRSIDVSDETFSRVQAAVNDNQSLIELIAIIATYNMTNRFQRALNFD
jgi:alkylhydroperoxidase family enzyme